LDYLNLLGWAVGLKTKVDDQLLLQFQIGNDLNAGESVTWANNKAPQGRVATDNLYVHLAYAAWNPGPIYLIGGVIPVVSNGTLDLLERSLSTGSYGEAIFQTWATQTNNSLIAAKLGVPLAKEDVKVNFELTTSVIDPRAQTLIGNLKTTGAIGSDNGVTTDPDADPSSVLLIFDLPIVAGDFKVTPEVTSVINRNFNEKHGGSDGEILAGLSAGLKLNDVVTLSLNGAYGTVSNGNSHVGLYGDAKRAGKEDSTYIVSPKVPSTSYESVGKDTVRVTTVTGKTIFDNKYISNGLTLGLGTTIKAGSGAFAIGFSYGNSNNSVKYTSDSTYTTRYLSSITYDTLPDNTIVADSTHEIPNTRFHSAYARDTDNKTLTNKNDFLFDFRYTWNVHPKLSIVPRWRVYYTAYEAGSGHIKSKMENRPELIITGTF